MNEWLQLVCTACERTLPANTAEWLCKCGEFFDFSHWPSFEPGRINLLAMGLWRYRELLPLESSWEPVTLGEGWTPLLPVDWGNTQIQFKLEYLAPTGSFKDRGTSVLVTALRGLGISSLVEDSSGNAGASLAAYSARAGIACELCVPDTVSAQKLAEMAYHGAEIIQIRGKRSYAALAAWAAAAHGAYYASHVYSPFFLAGIETLAYEIWEQLGQREPGTLLVPVGNGTLLVGLSRGFRRLLHHGLISQLPMLVAVQAEACAPLFRAFAERLDVVEPVASSSTVANSIAISRPARAAQMLEVLRGCDSLVLQVSDAEIIRSRDALAREGFFVEACSAAALAALGQIADVSRLREPIVIPLTGHGLNDLGGPRTAGGMPRTPCLPETEG